jgi:hypothetical protein
MQAANSLSLLVSGSEIVQSTMARRQSGSGAGFATKKSISRLALSRETVKRLVDTETARIIDGLPASCTGVTRLASGCSSGIHADSLALNL